MFFHSGRLRPAHATRLRFSNVSAPREQHVLPQMRGLRIDRRKRHAIHESSPIKDAMPLIDVEKRMLLPICIGEMLPSLDEACGHIEPGVMTSGLEQYQRAAGGQHALNSSQCRFKIARCVYDIRCYDKVKHPLRKPLLFKIAIQIAERVSDKGIFFELAPRPVEE